MQSCIINSYTNYTMIFIIIPLAYSYTIHLRIEKPLLSAIYPLINHINIYIQVLVLVLMKQSEKIRFRVRVRIPQKQSILRVLRVRVPSTRPITSYEGQCLCV